MNPFRNMWNTPYIQEHAINQTNLKSQESIAYECIQKLKDFLDSTEKIDPENQDIVGAACCMIVIDYIKKHSNNNMQR